MSKLKDLDNGETPLGCTLQSWVDDDTIFLTFGYVNIAMPITEFDTYVQHLLRSQSKLTSILQAARRRKGLN